MKKERRLAILLGCGALTLLMVLALFLPRRELTGWKKMDDLPRSWQQRIQKTLWEVIDICQALPGESRTDIDHMESELIARGWPVEDTDKDYPSYLANSQSLTDFWEAAAAGRKAETRFLRISEDGGFGMTCLLSDGTETRCVLIGVGWQGGKPYVRTQEVLPVYDMVLADWGTFYYRLYPEDPHYIDYMQLRLAPPDRENYNLCRKYILPIGYQMVNFFLVDWQEGDWGEMSFADVFEYLYEERTGETVFPWTDYVDPDNTLRARVPASLFEETIQSFLNVSREELRQEAFWSEVGYPWRTFFGDDLTSRSYPLCEPVVTGVRENEDGTFTLSVEVGSPEKKTNRLFSHEVTIRPLADGRSQYVANRVTEIGPWGLPYHLPRFTLDG